MLKNMNDEEKIFRAWLRKIIKIDKAVRGKKITGTELAMALCTKGSTITAYHSGRVSGGVKKPQFIPKEIRDAILDYTETPYEEMVEIGRKELQPPDKFKGFDEARLLKKAGEVAAKVTEVKLEGFKAEIKANRPEQKDDIKKKIHEKNKDHHDIVDAFKQGEVAKVAYEMNKDLLEITQLDPTDAEELRDLHDIIKLKRDKLRKKHGKDDDPEDLKNGSTPPGSV